MKMKGCPLLIQSHTSPSMMIRDESYTKSYMLECIGNKCAAYVSGDCGMFGRINTVILDGEDGEVNG